MGRFLFPSFFRLWLLAGCLFFPFVIGAQSSAGWALAGDRIEEKEGRGLVIRTNPTGARVYIDGIEDKTTRTPLFLRDLRAGEYLVQVELEGYKGRRFRVSVRPGSVLDVSLELQKASGKVLLKIKPASGGPDQALFPLAPRISVDGTNVDWQSDPSQTAEFSAENPLEILLEFPAGFRTILVRAFGCEDISTTVYIEEDSSRELELNLKPVPLTLSGASVSRTRFNPANAGSLGTTTFNFDVSAPGTGNLTVLDEQGETVAVRALKPFETWYQSVVWDGRNDQGEVLPDGVYTMIVKAASFPRDNYPSVEENLALTVELDSLRVIHPLTLSSAKSGLLYAPLPSLLPSGSFQIEGSLLAGYPPETGEYVSGRPWRSLPFAAGFRFSPVEQMELNAALNVIPRFKDDTSAGGGGGIKWAFRNSGEDGLPLGAAAGAVVSWTGKTGLTPFGMASGVELYFPVGLDLGRIFSIALTPAALWTGDEGFPWEPAPRLLVSGAVMMQMTYVSAGISIRTEYNFSGDPWPPSVITGFELKIFPPPSSFVFSLLSGIWIRDGDIGGFGGLGIGMIH